MSATLVSTVQILIGLVGLVAGGELLVRGAAALAGAARISPLVIGLTVVAFGAPELAVGNVVGSNLFNILAVLGLGALVASGGIAFSVCQHLGTSVGSPDPWRPMPGHWPPVAPHGVYR